jgi:hypothetical protein
MLKVGIQENLVFEKAAINEKGTLGIVFRPAKLSDSNVVYDEFSEDGVPMEVTNESGNSPLLMFCPKKPGFKNKDGSDLSDDDVADFLKRDFETLSNQLTLIVGAYRSTKDLKWKPYIGTGLDKSNWKTEILAEDIQQKIYNNYVTQFIEVMAPFMDKDEFKIRLKLIRQSKDKHYATLPSKFISDNPFIEPMEVPAEASKVKFSKWEKDKGLDSGEPVNRAEADPIPETTEEATDDVFGKR